MAGNRGAPTGLRSGRRGRLVPAVAVGIALAFVSSTVALAEGIVCAAGDSCQGTLLSVGATGDANSSQGIAVSGMGDANGPITVAGTRGEATVSEPTLTTDTYGVENTGDADFPITPGQILDSTYTPPPEVVAAKNLVYNKLVPEIEYQLAALEHGLDPTLADRACPDGRCPSRTRTLSQPLTHQITNYYCAPASTAIVLQQITGASQDQHAIASAENTSSQNGTTYPSVVKQLNARQGSVRFIASELAQDRPSSYMAKLVSAVDYWDGYPNHSIINNVWTQPLESFWGKKHRPARHYNVSHGYNLAGGGWVNIAEVYNSAAVGSSRSTNPYGYHNVKLSQIYSAVMQNKRIVIW